MSKLVIAIQGISNTGKTKTIIQFANELVEFYKISPNPIERIGNEISCVFEIQGCKIGIISQGDPGTGLEEKLNELVKDKCKIIVCATRTYGETTRAVAQACSEYEKVWLRKTAIWSEYNEKKLRDIANTNCAKLVQTTIKDYMS